MKNYIVELLMEKLKITESSAICIYEDLEKNGQITDIKSAMDFGLYSYYLTDSDVRRSKRFKVINSIYELDKYL